MNGKIKISPQCYTCLLNKYIDKVPEGASDEERINYARGVLKIMAEAPLDITAPEIVALVAEYKNSLFGYCDDFYDIKVYFNRLMLDKMPKYQRYIDGAEDRLLAALKLAMLGNYIDFGALDKVDENKLDEIPKDADELKIDEEEYSRFVSQLKAGKKLVYLTDNCGEVVLDRLFISEIKKVCPQLDITVIVKGGAVLNDATREDAETVGLFNVANVIDNGNSVAGTALSRCSYEAIDAIDGADVIISKGQANFETLGGCGRNIYYLFLCKCSMYSKKFNVPPFTGMFFNEEKLKSL